MNTSQSLTFQGTPWVAVLGLSLVVFTAAVCFIAWQRSGYRNTTGLLEALRLAIVTLVGITLMQPEWLVEYLPSKRATIVVLADASKSMETRDVTVESHSSSLVQSRAESIQAIHEEEFWQPLTDHFDIVRESFSSSLPDSVEGTNIHDALVESLRRNERVAAIVLASDGDWNVGEPPSAAASQLRMRKVPVFAVPTGSESRQPDLDLVRVDAPTFGVLGKPLRIPIVIESSLPRDTAVRVTLAPSSGEAITTQFNVPAMSQLADSLVWTPKEQGDFELTVKMPVDVAETVAENNQRVVPISIRQEKLNVLLVESFPRWEYRYLRNALQRDPGVDVHCLLFHPGLSKVGGGKGYLQSFPATIDELAEYDVVFLGDVGVESKQLTPDDCRLIKALVHSQASGLVWMPGMRGAHLSFQGTELEELYPVVLDPSQPRGWGSETPAHMELTESGRRSLLTQLEDNDETNAQLWESLPGFQWFAAVLRPRAGTEVLATHKSQSTSEGRLPLLVTKTYGTGKILFLGTDAAWRWREGVEDKYHYRFWGQVARWMAYQRSMAQGETMRLFFSPDRPKVGDTVALFANVMQSSGEPLRDGNVVVQINGPTGKTETVRLAPEDEWGLYQGFFTPNDFGQYKLRLVTRHNDATLETTLSVQDTRRERLGQPARADVLSELASLTGGQVVETSDLHKLVATIADMPEPEPSVRRLRIWCHPVWAGLLVGLLGIFWTGRKLTGVI